MNNLKKTSVMPCLLETWHHSEAQIYAWLLKQSGDMQLSSDLLQDTFLKALKQNTQFCDIQNQRAWLYKVAKNLLIDAVRQSQKVVLQPSFNDHIDEQEAQSVVDSLTECLPNALAKLSVHEREIITRCDLQGVSQQSFADSNNLSLVATKSRIQRARRKLKSIIQKDCHVRFDSQQRVCCFYRENN
ncbi:sigma-70 family RNA polymerase sigma factor [Shewanella yunxiaonensis]|uniref:Sigma-70 family RNA polymerase sigma factor n=1 Tax=Shewanella yunxiaonensis TaxID=2829809 RepID=A0ABX7YXD3_9GAMM|nr:sigma-70 family RNA polymerase sigma factor [Shewanella yunxiaonensis]QUN06980.1 sigma-70 family RNA polymerase sigma factor [Shewanella yunxiaonensis]